MKNIYKKLTLTLLLISNMFCLNQLSAQNKDTAAADKLFQRFEYVAASKAYLDLVGKGKKDNYIYRQLADSYYNMFNTTEAIKWYALVVTQNQDAETHFKYAQMLKGSAKYEEANKQMAIFASKAPNDQRAITFKENPNYIPKLLDKQRMFDVKLATINSEKSDFGAILTNDNMVYFSSARNNVRRKNATTEEPYLDIYQSVYTPENDVLSAAVTADDLNTPWHDGLVSVSSDGNTMYFARDSRSANVYEKSKAANAKFFQVHLYKAIKSNGKWTDVTPLPINNKAYTTANPSISKDGKILYFSSNMPGGEGGNDIWKINVDANNIYGLPENLGKGVNTPGNEQFPHITENNMLYFSSSARQGLGGLDVFVMDLNTAKPEAINVGKPVNSEKDDFAFSYNSNKNKGFFASNRSGGDDIYMATALCGVTLTSTVSDAKTGKTLSNAVVTILDDKKNIIQSKNTDDGGQVSYDIECGKAYVIQATKDGYESGSFEVLPNKGGATSVAAALNPIETIIKPTEILLKPIMFEYDKSNITQEGAFELNQLVMVMKNNPDMIIMVKSHTDSRGSDQYNMKLSDRRAKSTVQYIISKGITEGRISGSGYGKSEPKVDCKDACTETDHAANRRSEFLIVK